MNKERIVITGIGLVCPVGHDVESAWQALLAGKSSADYTTIFNASTFPTTFSSEVKNFDPSKFIKNFSLHKGCSRGSGFALVAAKEACTQAKIDIETENPADGIDRTRMGIYMGCGEASVNNDVFFNCLAKAWDNQNNKMDWPKWTQIASAGFTAANELEQEPNMPTTHIAMLTGARGPISSCLTACAAGTQAVGEAAMLIRHGKADIVISGGAHSMIHPLGVMGFSRLTALSRRNESPQTASRPFTASRDGFLIGEGSAVLILESLASAKRRGVKILAEIIGYGSSCDAFRVTDMHEEARGPIQAMTAALTDAGITSNDVDYISTHGTSTFENDSIETKAIKAVFKDANKYPPASSIKSVMGHLIGAAGAAEIISCVLAIRDNILPPTINLNDPDPQLGLDYIPNKPRKAVVNIAMKESFGFGGQNNVVIIKRYEE